MDTRPYLYDKITPDESLDLSGIIIPIDYRDWKRPRNLSIENLGGLLSIKINENLFKERNVTSVEYLNQEQNPELPPETYKVNLKTHIAVDDNYLYVWVETKKKWKRCLLSDWEFQ